MANGVGPYIFSLAFDLTGNYNGILIIFAIAIVGFAIAFMTIPEPRLKSREF